MPRSGCIWPIATRSTPCANWSRFTWNYFNEHPEFLSLLGTENLHRARHLKTSKKIRELHSPLVGIITVLLERGVKAKVFREGVDPVQLYITIASLGFFYMSNRFTLSTIFGRDLGNSEALAERGKHIEDVVLRLFAAVTAHLAASLFSSVGIEGEQTKIRS